MIDNPILWIFWLKFFEKLPELFLFNLIEILIVRSTNWGKNLFDLGLLLQTIKFIAK